MNILAFDTSADIMYITLGQDDLVLDSRIVKSSEQNYNSAFLVSTIADILRKNNKSIVDLNALGVNIGPGSFTGLRASVTVARIIAQQINIPAVGTPSLQIYSGINNTEKNSLCIMDARKGKAYIGVYDKDSCQIEQPCAVEYQKAIDMAKKEDFFIISDKRISALLDENSLNYTKIDSSGADYGKILLKLTYRQVNIEKDDKYQWFNLKPLYIQPPPITMPK